MNALTIQEPRRASLIDVVLINAKDPSLYGHIPSASAKSMLEAGDAVKIGLQSELTPGAYPESFWVEIVERRGREGFVGKVQNDLQPGYGLLYGDLLVFAGQHIIEIEAGK